MERCASHWGRRFPKVIIGCLCVLGTASFAANLTVTVDNIEENKGKVHVVIYDATNWLGGDPDNFAGSQSVDITERKDNGPLVINVELEPGEYGCLRLPRSQRQFQIRQELHAGAQRALRVQRTVQQTPQAQVRGVHVRRR